MYSEVVQEGGRLVAKGLMVRDIANHPVEQLAGRTISACKLDDLGGNTTISMHLAEIQPGDEKCNHRHIDETLVYIVSGRGRTELRQSDYRAPVSFDWGPGDLVAVPMNAWHRHRNASDQEPARQLSFRNTPLLNRILHGDGSPETKKELVYNRSARFENRFNDDLDWFSLCEHPVPGQVRANAISGVVSRMKEWDLDGGDDGSSAEVGIDMGGQLTLEVAAVRVAAGSSTDGDAPFAEEVMLVLEGSGSTTIGEDEGKSIAWQAGDVFSVPLGWTRRHRANEAADGAYLLRVRNVAIARALSVSSTTFDPEALRRRLPGSDAL